jgi:tripartite-type tricarboxylate transporter receptor subunit TctC
MALPIAAPPDLPPERARALQDGFMAMTRDPAFIEDAKRMNVEQSPIDGEAVRRIITQMSATPKDVIAQFNEIVGAKN